MSFAYSAGRRPEQSGGSWKVISFTAYARACTRAGIRNRASVLYRKTLHTSPPALRHSRTRHTPARDAGARAALSGTGQMQTWRTRTRTRETGATRLSNGMAVRKHLAYPRARTRQALAKVLIRLSRDQTQSVAR